MLTRIMRDYGFDFYWEDKYCENLVAPGFGYNKDFGACRAVTAIEVLEHVVDPINFISESLRCGNANTIIFTTELYEGSPPKPDDWWYYSFSTGQHIGFFQHRTLEVIANKLGLNFTSASGIHIISDKKINKFSLRLVANSYLSLFTPIFIRKRLGTKTLLDHELMIKKIDSLSNKQ